MKVLNKLTTIKKKLFALGRLVIWSLSYLRWGRKQYAEFYRMRQDRKALEDPKKAVGGLWEEMGRIQLDFLVSRGLKPEHVLLDVGCGSLRGGLRFIEYLHPGNYWGIDISPNILESGRKFVTEKGFESKNPHLLVNNDLKFDELAGSTFDYILAQSVFTHMPEEDIDECFQNLHKILKPSGVFFATFSEGPKKMYHKVVTRFSYPASLFYRLGEEYGYQVEIDDGFAHPRGLKMLAIRYK